MWVTLGSSVIGASHIKRNIENQDSISTCENIIAISDGHGSAGYTRSSYGAKFATNIITEIYTECPLSVSMKDLDIHIRHLKTRFLYLWQKACELDLEENPISMEEFERISGKPEFLKNFNVHNKVVYGCTFLCAIVYKDFILLLNHGDGDVLAYNFDEVYDLTIYNEKNFANATLSLASLKDASEISHRIIEDIPSLLVLCTDGVKNSYNDTDPETIAQFYKIPVAIRNSIIEEGKSKAEERITTLLEKITKEGSGDDVTIAVLFKV